MTRTDTSELDQYLENGWQLIPLHRHDYYDEYRGKKRERGKSPRHSNWTRRPYDSNDQVGHMEGGGNVGVRLRSEDLVIDVDPRNFKEGDDPLARLCEDCGVDPGLYPTVETGSGGLHIYMKKPDDVSVRDSLPDYEGVEFKTGPGRQVVSAGSIHPTTKRVYVWDFLRPTLEEVSEAPTRLLNIIRRPAGAAATGGGEHTQEDLANMLDVLDPEDFREHSDWLTLMQACHHATAGDGRAEFVEWSTRDPQYRDDGGLIGRRWDSLHADTNGARVTHRTLHKILRDADQGDVIPRQKAEDDFETVGPDDDPQDEVEEHERQGPVERMNGPFIAVMDGSQFRIMWEQVDPSSGDPDKGIPARKAWVRAKPYDFHQMLLNKKVEQGDKVIQLSEAWLKWGGRRSARGVIFDPEHDHEGYLNLWTGWGVEARKSGSWSMLDELLRDGLCDGDERVYDYALDWAAHMIQHPGSPAEVAVCFQGLKGCGKGTWGRVLCQLAGGHGMHITSSEQLTGRFNDHLRNVILLFADEAIKPYDKEGEGRLKGLITEPRIAFEGKGKDVVTAKNMLHVIMASNEDYFVPMGLDGERRFVLQRANSKYVGRHRFFDDLHRQLADGGLSALLWDLTHRDIGDWAPRKDLPVTKASMEQKLRNLTPVGQWWFNILTEGELPMDPTRGDMDWTFDPVRVFKEDLRSSFDEHCRQNGIRSAGGMSRSIDMMFAKEIKKLVPDLKDRIREPVPDERFDVRAHNDNRAWAIELPSLGQCRGSMEELLGGDLDWGTTED